MSMEAIINRLLLVLLPLVAASVVRAQEDAPATEPVQTDSALHDCNIAPVVAPYCYYGRVEAVYYDRDNDSLNRPIVDIQGGPVALTTNDLNFDYEPGVRVLFGVCRGPCCHCSAWEFEYLGIFDWNASAQVTGTDNLQLAGDLGSGVVNGFVNADDIRIDYESNLHSLEANCIQCCCDDGCRRIELLKGFRYISLDEDLLIRSDNVGAQVDALYTVDASNDLYGAQVGARVRQFNCGWGWEFTGKGGVFLSDSSQSQVIVDQLPANPIVFRNASASESDVAFVGELNLSLLYQLSCRTTLRAGYNVLWIEGIALAPDQLDFTATPNSGTFIDGDSGLLAHGLSVGGEICW